MLNYVWCVMHDDDVEDEGWWMTDGRWWGMVHDTCIEDDRWRKVNGELWGPESDSLYLSDDVKYMP